MRVRHIVVGAAAVAMMFVAACASPARAEHELVRGFVNDGVTGGPLNGVRGSLSPPTCAQLTDQAGMYQIHFAHGRRDRSHAYSGSATGSRREISLIFPVLS